MPNEGSRRDSCELSSTPKSESWGNGTSPRFSGRGAQTRLTKRPDGCQAHFQADQLRRRVQYGPAALDSNDEMPLLWSAYPIEHLRD